jgi:dipeptidyl aminopeptidase/acylaminoacyl peptidase
MFGSLFAADGTGLRPTIILLHGFPGVSVVPREALRNVLELAQPLQRAGFNVLTFNYRGSWGSQGSFSLTGRIEDVGAATTFVKSLQQFNVDPARLSVIGHSEGGFTAIIASIEDPNLRCTVGIAPANYGPKRVERIQRSRESADIDYPVVGLSGYTARDHRREILANQPRFNLAARMPSLKGRPLLIIQAKRDETIPANEVLEYVDAARAAGVAPLEHVLVDANHSFSLENSRKELAAVVVGWVTRFCK